LRILRRREVREIRQVTDIHGNTHTSLSEITAAFVSHMSHKYQPIALDEAAIANLQTFIHPVCPATYAEQLEQPITYDELLTALRAGARRKSPLIDGLSLEFYTANRETAREELLQFLNYMFRNKNISPRQKNGILGCPPTHAHLMTIAQFLFLQLSTSYLSRSWPGASGTHLPTSYRKFNSAVSRTIRFWTPYPVCGTSWPKPRPPAAHYAS
jgi:hypothetical protein